MNTLKTSFLATLVGVALVTSAAAQTNLLITVDEYGRGNYNGSPLQSGMMTDPFSGMTTLGYILPFPTLPGDVVLVEAGTPLAVAPSDIIRFDGQGHLFFFSDSSPLDPPDAPADVPQLPPLLTQYPVVTLNEIGPEGNNGAQYFPLAGQPGSLPTGAPVQYNFISDIPEPASILVATLGGGLLLLLNLRRQAGRD